MTNRPPAPTHPTDAAADVYRRSARLNLERRAYAAARATGAKLERTDTGGYVVHPPGDRRPRPCRDLADVLLVLVYLPIARRDRT